MKTRALSVTALLVLTVILSMGILLIQPVEVGACPEYTGCSDPNLRDDFCGPSPGARNCAIAFLEKHCNGGLIACRAE